MSSLPSFACISLDRIHPSRNVALVAHPPKDRHPRIRRTSFLLLSREPNPSPRTDHARPGWSQHSPAEAPRPGWTGSYPFTTDCPRVPPMLDATRPCTSSRTLGASSLSGFALSFSQGLGRGEGGCSGLDPCPRAERRPTDPSWFPSLFPSSSLSLLVFSSWWVGGLTESPSLPSLVSSSCSVTRTTTLPTSVRSPFLSPSCLSPRSSSNPFHASPTRSFSSSRRKPFVL